MGTRLPKQVAKAAMALAEREITIQAPWGKIRGVTWGEAHNPPVFLCHGRMDVCSGFRRLVTLLPPRFHYVAVDLPGNGLSDHFPPGVKLSAIDLLPTVKYVKEHFKWDNFVYIGHSLGVVLGKFFNIVYPGHITKMVELDPIPAYDTYRADPETFRSWYLKLYEGHYGEQYGKVNSGVETAPRYSYEKVLEMVMKARGLDREAAETVVERGAAPAGDGLYRFTHDQRYKLVVLFPFSGETYRSLYIPSKTPTLCVLATQSIEHGCYNDVPFIKDESMWPNGNYKVKTVEGGHDIHISKPESMAEDISKFLLGAASKL